MKYQDLLRTGIIILELHLHHTRHNNHVAWSNTIAGHGRRL